MRAILELLRNLAGQNHKNINHDFLISVKWTFLHRFNVGEAPLKLPGINHSANYSQGISSIYFIFKQLI